ncbi:MAG: 3-hydroxybutyryl-CoA dehydrogenase [Chloroflexi bacterium]|nr:3-hydroxybutyryl-CoA dehydrogenase [Chloroflexota bacterium]
MELKKIGVVGCGLMGGGIAQVAAEAGYQVVVREINQELLAKGMNVIRGNLARNVEKGRMTQQAMDDTLARLKGTTELADFKDRDMVIEAIFEDIEEKKKLFATLDGICRPDAILASNTSSLTVVEMAAATKRASKVVGIHFFSPVPVMKLVEIVKTIVTSDDTLETAVNFGKTVGKTVVTAKDLPGFIVNRLLIPFLIDAARVYGEGLATREDIDAAIALGLNHPMGPLTLMDFVGIDITVHAADALYREYGDPRYAAPPILRRMLLAGHVGRKTGKGFYEYTK